MHCVIPGRITSKHCELTHTRTKSEHISLVTLIQSRSELVSHGVGIQKKKKEYQVSLCRKVCAGESKYYWIHVSRIVLWTLILAQWKEWAVGVVWILNVHAFTIHRQVKHNCCDVIWAHVCQGKLTWKPLQCAHTFPGVQWWHCCCIHALCVGRSR